MIKHGMATLALAIASAAACTQAVADEFPAHSVRLIAAFAPGGALDLIARSIAENMTQQWKQTVYVDNKAGAAGIIGTETAAKAPPDGYTLLMGVTTTHGINPSLYTKLPYDAIKDFAPVSLVATIPHVLVVNPAMPVSNLKEFIQYAKAKPGGLNYGSAGLGSPHHLAAELLRTKAGFEAQNVPYKGTGPAMLAVMSGEADFMSVEVTGAAPYLTGGKLKALAVASEHRMPGLDVPTFAEAGVPDFEVTSWYAIFAPAGTPPDIVDKLNKAVVAAVRSPAVKDRLSGLWAVPVGSTPDELLKFEKDDIARWAVAVKTSGAKAD
jgi:tripartite-type tricarboxylate transporter receptor subunit TctC